MNGIEAITKYIGMVAAPVKDDFIIHFPTIEAITKHNGWAMAFMGICIVFTGLVLLSITLSQLHKILDLWDKRSDFFDNYKEKKKLKAEQIEAYSKLTVDGMLENNAKQFNILAQTMNEPFALPGLLDLALKRGLYKPHSAINQMLEIKLIIPDGEGYYFWDKRVYQNILRKGKDLQ